jgi:hypothetical protein
VEDLGSLVGEGGYVQLLRNDIPQTEPLTDLEVLTVSSCKFKVVNNARA